MHDSSSAPLPQKHPAGLAYEAATLTALPRLKRKAHASSWRAKVAVACLAVLLAGCGAIPRNATPPELMPQAVVAQMPDIRANAGRISAVMERDLAESFAQESVLEFPRAADGRIHYAHLALSGGGPQGAFGAGFLKGWTTSGKRPVFKIVTSVSTGALIAPFAFLGPDHDEALHDFYTTTASKDIFIFKVFALIRQLFVGDSLLDTRPLVGLIERYVDEALLADIAKAHLSGRRLYIGTADLDSQSFVIWNMGKIATSGRPGALELFRKVMLASASIPVAFPPVLFEVEADGRRYDEMHVDGAVGANVFYSGGIFRTSEIRERAGRGNAQEHIFVIHNGQLGPVPQATPRTIRSIALRTVDSAGKGAVIGDLFRIHSLSQREKATFQWITIPNGVNISGNELFDPIRMQELYEVGRLRALAETPWYIELPGLQDRPPEN